MQIGKERVARRSEYLNIDLLYFLLCTNSPYVFSRYGDATNPFSGTALGRFPSDMLFFPTAQQNNVDPVPDDIDTSAEIAAVETTLTGLDEMSFNTQFGKVVAKMFKIGTSSSLTPFSTGSTTC